MTRLADIMAATGMTRDQIRRAVATGAGRFNPDTYARVRSQADQRLANLFMAMRGQREMTLDAPIETAEQAGVLRRMIKKHSPVETGRLKRSWNDPDTVQIMPDGRVEIEFAVPYARIQDLGGTIHRVSSRGKSYMIHIPAQHYVDKALSEYAASRAAEKVPISSVSMGVGGPLVALIEMGRRVLQGMEEAT